MLLRSVAAATFAAARTPVALRRHCSRTPALALCARWFSSTDAPTDSSVVAPEAVAVAPAALSGTSKESVLPAHIKFRMPDLDFEHISGGNGAVTLSKWHVSEGDEIKDGAQMCEIDTPDLNFVLESGDVGFIARILVPEGATNVTPNQPLVAIVPTAADIQPFIDALRAHPRAIESYVEPKLVEVTPAESNVPEGSDVLRALQRLHKDGAFASKDEQLKVLKSLARKNDEQLLVTFRGSFADETFDDATFNREFFVENALELADEALARAS